MHPKRKRRLFAVIAIIVGVGIAGGLTVWSLQQNMLFFISPTDVVQQDLPAGRQFRLGGLVEPGSVARADDSLEVEFVVTMLPVGANVRSVLQDAGVIDAVAPGTVLNDSSTIDVDGGL